MTQEQKEPFFATIKMDEQMAATILRGLGKLTVDEAGELAFLFRQDFLMQKQAFLQSNQNTTKE